MKKLSLSLTLWFLSWTTVFAASPAVEWSSGNTGALWSGGFWMNGGLVMLVLWGLIVAFTFPAISQYAYAKYTKH